MNTIRFKYPSSRVLSAAKFRVFRPPSIDSTSVSSVTSMLREFRDATFFLDEIPRTESKFSRLRTDSSDEVSRQIITNPNAYFASKYSSEIWRVRAKCLKNFEADETRAEIHSRGSHHERERHMRARLGKEKKGKKKQGEREERERGRGIWREKSGRHARAREGGPNNISKLMSCGAFQRGPVDSAPPFCIR